VPSAGDLLLAGAIVTAASALQASVGFGLALVAAPLLALLDRDYVPGPLIGAGMCLSLIMAARERGAIDLSGVRSASLGRLIGVLPAGAALHLVSAGAFDALFSTLVLAAVGLSLLHREVRPTSRSVFGAGIASGFMGTITSIGGPPVALVYQSSHGPELRATLAGIFAVGSVISLAALALIGRFGAPELLLAAALVPGVILGVALSRPLLLLLDRGATRPLVLTLSAGSALAVLGRALLR
jgi:uncharacterized protein